MPNKNCTLLFLTGEDDIAGSIPGDTVGKSLIRMYNIIVIWIFYVCTLTLPHMIINKARQIDLM
jgi:hypothetical protein